MLCRYLADVRWIKTWKKYVGYDHWDLGGTGLDNPGPIDNSSLFEGDRMIYMYMYMYVHVVMCTLYMYLGIFELELAHMSRHANSDMEVCVWAYVGELHKYTCTCRAGNSNSNVYSEFV